MNTALLSYLSILGLGAPSGDRLITQEDIARAFGGRPAELSKALHSADDKGGARMLLSISMAARALQKQIGTAEIAALPIYWSRAEAAIKVLEAMLPAGDPRAVKMRGLL